jgi:hypothetical protein
VQEPIMREINRDHYVACHFPLGAESTVAHEAEAPEV